VDGRTLCLGPDESMLVAANGESGQQGRPQRPLGANRHLRREWDRPWAGLALVVVVQLRTERAFDLSGAIDLADQGIERLAEDSRVWAEAWPGQFVDQSYQRSSAPAPVVPLEPPGPCFADGRDSGAIGERDRSFVSIWTPNSAHGHTPFALRLNPNLPYAKAPRGVELP
jgi:hypothetical protein